MPKDLGKKIGAAASVTLLSGIAVAAAAPPAQAAALNCAYPYVCLYNSAQTRVERYQEVTSGWQSFSRPDVYFGINTRKDDVAYIRYTKGNVFCMAADSANVIWGRGVPNGIRISSSDTC